MSFKSFITVLLLLTGSPTVCAAFTLLEFVPIVQTSEMYDDNIALAPSNRQSDWVSTVLAGGELNYHSGQRDGSIQYETVGQLFAHHSEYDSFGDTHFASFRDEEFLSRSTSLSLSDWFVDGTLPSSLLTAVANVGAQPTLNSQLALALLANGHSLSNFADLNAVHDLNEQWQTLSRFQQEYFSTSTNTSVFTNGDFGLLRSLTPSTHAAAGYAYYDFRATNPSTSLQAHYPQIGVDWEALSHLDINGKMGPILFVRDMPRGNSVNLGYDVSLQYSTERWRFATSSGQEPGITPDGGSGLTRSALGDLNYSLSQSLRLFAGISYYQLSGGTGRLELFSYGGGFAYDLNRWAALSGQYVTLNEYAGGGTSLTGGPEPYTSPVSHLVTLGLSISFEGFRKAL